MDKALNNDKLLSAVLLGILKGNCDDHEDIDISVTDYTPGRSFQLYVGVEGIIKGLSEKGQAVNRHFIVGYHPISFSQITRAGTTATNLAACFYLKK
jgi:hypothetical protein